VLDSSGHGHHGHVEGPVSRGERGPLGRAYRFRGGRVRVPGSPSLDQLAGGSITAWVRVDLASEPIVIPHGPMGRDPAPIHLAHGVGSFASRGTGNMDNNVLFNTSCGNLQIVYSRELPASGTTNTTTDCDAIERGRWHHLAAVNDGRSSHVYLDGVLVKTTEGGFLGPIDGDLLIGERGGLFALDGAIDELGWWTRPLSAEEVCRDARGRWSRGVCERQDH
jgi:hypothetical protein